MLNLGVPWTLQKYKFQVDGCFLWSTGSWDALAVYPESATDEGSYFDPVVAQIIDAHNSAARKEGHAFIAPSRDAARGSVRKFRSGIGVPLRRAEEPPAGQGDWAAGQADAQPDAAVALRKGGTGVASRSRLALPISDRGAGTSSGQDTGLSGSADPQRTAATKVGPAHDGAEPLGGQGPGFSSGQPRRVGPASLQAVGASYTGVDDTEDR